MDPAVQTKFLEIDCSLYNVDREVIALGVALDASDRVIADARLRHRALMASIKGLLAEIAIVKEMWGVK